MPSRLRMRRHRKVGLREATIHARPSGEFRTSLKEILTGQLACADCRTKGGLFLETSRVDDHRFRKEAGNALLRVEGSTRV